MFSDIFHLFISVFIRYFTPSTLTMYIDRIILFTIVTSFIALSHVQSRAVDEKLKLKQITNKWYVLAIHDDSNQIPKKIDYWTIEIIPRNHTYNFLAEYTLHDVEKNKVIDGGAMVDDAIEVDGRLMYKIPLGNSDNDEFIVYRQGLDEGLEIWNVILRRIKVDEPFCTLIVSLDPTWTLERETIVNDNLVGEISYVVIPEDNKQREITNNWYVLAFHDDYNQIPEKIACWTIEIIPGISIFDFTANYSFYDVKKNEYVTGGAAFDNAIRVDTRLRYKVPVDVFYDLIIDRRSFNNGLELWNVTLREPKRDNQYCSLIVSPDSRLTTEGIEIMDRRLLSEKSYVSVPMCP